MIRSAIFYYSMLSMVLAFVVPTEAIAKYSQVRIHATSPLDFRRIEATGLFIDHASTKLGHYSDAWLSDSEIELLKKSGVPYDILVDDWDAYYQSLPRMTQAEMDAAIRRSAEQYNVSHSIYGSMGGFMTYTEVVAKLDSMRLQYPSLISAKFSIGTTIEGRQMWVVRITKNPDAPTGRPEVLYHALIHAREPESMETQFYYFYWLFENYGTDPIATYILNNREIYWLPVFNADGYVYNQTTYPTGGGMWRANRRITGGSCGPVDPNRNYGIYQFWNSSNGGSSTDSCSGGQGTYRGRTPFSEPETQNIMNFVNSRNFNAAFGAHTYGNYLIKPWAWSDPSPTPDDAKFNLFLADMKASNPVYTTGTPSQTVGYTVRGGADDWYYNDSTHPGHHIFAITPETGSTGFWPTQAEIVPLAQGMLFNNQYMSLIGGPYVGPLSRAFNQQTYTPGQSGTYKVVFRNKGALTASNVKVSLTSTNSNITIPTTEFTYPSLASFAADSCTFNFTISSGVANNSAIPTLLRMKMDTSTIYSANVYVLIGAGSIVLNDTANVFTNWTTSGSWAVTTAQSHTAPSSFTDSPGGNYGNNANNSMTLASPINASAMPVLSLSFYHRYATESGYDYCNVEVSSNNGSTWQPVASYDGTLSTWTEQTFDVSSYANGSTQAKIRFRLTSDVAVVADGWYVDDIRVRGYTISSGTVPVAPSLASPSNGAVNQPLTLTVRWHPVSGTTRYTLQVATDSLFGTTIISDTTLTDTLRLISSLANSTRYFWRVSARNDAGAGSFSSAWSFSTIPAVPLVPSLVSPANGATNQPLTLTVRWHPVAGATRYTLQLATDSLFSSPIINDTTLTDTLRIVSSLSNSSRYFWRISARNGAGESLFSSPWSFTTTPPAPVAPVLVSPANGTTNHPATTLLVWRMTAFAETYHVQLSTDSLFLSTVLNDSTVVDTSKGVASLPSGARMFWRIRAKNVGGVGSWSAVWDFTVTTQTTRQYAVIGGWNMIAVPLAASDLRKTSLYPTASSAAFAFVQSVGYVPKDTLSNRIGYWLKFDTPGSVSLTGTPVTLDTIDVDSGWNLIGGISDAVDTASVVQDPTGIIIPPYYGYGVGYAPTDSLRPGVAYWVKSREPGRLILTSGLDVKRQVLEGLKTKLRDRSEGVKVPPGGRRD